jgi:hypothetical protein
MPQQGEPTHSGALQKLIFLNGAENPWLVKPKNLV